MKSNIIILEFDQAPKALYCGDASRVEFFFYLNFLVYLCVFAMLCIAFSVLLKKVKNFGKVVQIACIKNINMLKYLSDFRVVR